MNEMEFNHYYAPWGLEDYWLCPHCGPGPGDEWLGSRYDDDHDLECHQCGMRWDEKHGEYLTLSQRGDRDGEDDEDSRKERDKERSQ